MKKKLNWPPLSSCPPPPPLPTDYMSLSIAFKRSLFPLWWMDRWRREGEREETSPSRLRFPSSTSFFLPQRCNLASPCALSHPPLAPSSPSLTMHVLTLARPALQTGFAQEWQQREREREREAVTGPLPSVATPGSNNSILSEKRIIAVCILLPKCMILTPRSPLALQ